MNKYLKYFLIFLLLYLIYTAHKVIGNDFISVGQFFLTLGATGLGH